MPISIDRADLDDRTWTRAEFAADLNACIDRMNQPVAAGTDDAVKPEDLDTSTFTDALNRGAERSQNSCVWFRDRKIKAPRFAGFQIQRN